MHGGLRALGRLQSHRPFTVGNMSPAYRRRFSGLESLFQTVQSTPARWLLGNDELEQRAFFEEQKKRGVQNMQDLVNSTFQVTGVPLEVTRSGQNGLQNTSESDLRKRLAALQVEAKLIEDHLAREFKPSEPKSSQLPASALNQGQASPEQQLTQVQESSGRTHETSETLSTSVVQPVEVPMQGKNPATIVDGSEEGEEYVEPDELTRRLKKWYTVDACTQVPYSMISSFELYPQWMPFCQSGTILATHPVKGTVRAAVGFGIKVPFIGTLGDTIEYEIELEPPSGSHSQARVYSLSHKSRYMERLVYDWRFVPLDEFRTKVILVVEFKGAAKWYMPIWEALRKDVISSIYNSFSKRVVELQASMGGDKERPVLMPRLQSLRAVLQGPFLRDEAIVITESNGRTIRHANAAFAALARHPVDTLPGKDIPDLLQTCDTDTNVLRGVGAAVIGRIPATAVILNENNAGERFLNKLMLAPLDDDEKNTGVVFWAILRVVHRAEQRLEYSEPGAMDHVWGPEYEHPEAVRVKQVLQDEKKVATSQ